MLTDIYILAAERTLATAKRFMDAWTHGLTPNASEYEFPQYSDNPSSVYSSPLELISALIQAPAEAHAIYWNNPTQNHVRTAMLFFTADGSMIVGLSVDSDQQRVLEDSIERLAVCLEARAGYCAYEEPPPDTRQEFIDNARRAAPPKIVDGALIRVS